jgi:NTP pyrophosphatase (non-canonical NTP hydrolase)
MSDWNETCSQAPCNKPTESTAPKSACYTRADLAAALNDLSWLCRGRADRWYYDPHTGDRIVLNHGERFALMHSELSEAFEGVRKDKMDDHLPHRKAVEVELADAIIRICDYAGENKLDLGGALIEKLEYNAHREDHTYSARLKPHGKKF